MHVDTGACVGWGESSQYSEIWDPILSSRLRVLKDILFSDSGNYDCRVYSNFYMAPFPGRMCN